jgi:hypothetical protein
MSQTPQLPPAPQWLDHTQIGAALMSVPARISEVGRQLAEAQFLFTAAKEHREKEEAFLYQAARLQLEEGAEPIKDAKGNLKDPKPPTEAQVQALMRTDEVLAPRRDAAVMQEAVAEARYEALRADYRAVCTEADMVAESARNTRQELQNLDPTVRLAQLGRTYPTGPRRAEPGEVFALAEKMQQEQLLPADPRFSGFAPASTRAPSQRTITTGLGGNAEDEGPV